ncbi:ABC transporter permease [Burkholderia pseudomallei]|uniref:methionine ABC transporter permease n=1 Tax=Burkholderia pseudomallei TaxID=28450 RepID=UPI000F066FE3|nr:methionine ABC transporter permease [Burkholderia pseudomallei]MBF3995842.1 ABC transporter permease [Burkholderia pseudomallei]CAJ3599529.1 ABC transporter permease [Burkholderia pseudomallei]CAJ5230501.1 ABC transporter permease [Burkholderia pseudomallei]CAJ5744832.1 ABC transporter permease [Burkholderia pseudomallei]CAJ6423907.1 ABC transporter permease [Burkholderia pseudomallei]
MSELWLPELADAIRDTLWMVGASALVAALVGVPLALVLVTTAPGGLYERRGVNAALGAIVNAFRSTPFVILLVALLPFTRFVIGTTIGVWAAIVPLSIAAIPFFARIAEVSLREVDKGLVEAAQAMGAERRHIVLHVLLPEALPGIVGGFTITVVALIGSTAMAGAVGAVGAGGLGDLAIRYGYQRFDTAVMATVIAILIALVTVVQFTGDRVVRRLAKRA